MLVTGLIVALIVLMTIGVTACYPQQQNQPANKTATLTQASQSSTVGVASEVSTSQPTATLVPSPSPTPEVTGPEGTLLTLENVIVPQRNMSDLACRLKGLCNVPEVITANAAPLSVGVKSAFWTTNNDTSATAQITATLRYTTDHAYFWLQDGVTVADSDIQTLMDTFENKIYPTTRSFFGSEWTTGIDGDPHIYILYARNLGSSIAAYYSALDEINPSINEYSNGHEMFYINADTTALNSSHIPSILAHEFQHMIHWNNDENENAWINEGSSELSSQLNGYYPGGFEQFFISNPNLQLNDWPDDADPSANYGASYMFMSYFLDRFGASATQDLVKNPKNGLDGVDAALKELGATDPLNGNPIQADDFFMDWAVTNLINNNKYADGRYSYKSPLNFVHVAPTSTVTNCSNADLQGTVHQYAAEYIQIDCSGKYSIRFTGSASVNLLPVSPYSGQYAFWSNKGDDSDMTLTHQFDLTNVSSSPQLSFKAWYDIEDGWDYAYVLASTDGQSWATLPTTTGTSKDTSGNAYGNGLTGASGGWITENADLSAYAGKKIWVRFEYVTDEAINGDGLLIDDVSIDAIHYFSNFETDDGGWQAAGFARVENSLPQSFRLALVDPDAKTVTMIPLSEDRTASFPITLESGHDQYLVIAATTRFTRTAASYQISVQ
jgi:Uncharacterized protein conserved in bacteria